MDSSSPKQPMCWVKALSRLRREAHSREGVADQPGAIQHDSSEDIERKSPGVCTPQITVGRFPQALRL
jgi:hypothetical protein